MVQAHLPLSVSRPPPVLHAHTQEQKHQNSIFFDAPALGKPRLKKENQHETSAKDAREPRPAKLLPNSSQKGAAGWFHPAMYFATCVPCGTKMWKDGDRGETSRQDEIYKEIVAGLDVDSTNNAFVHHASLYIVHSRFRLSLLFELWTTQPACLGTMQSFSPSTHT